MPWIFHALNAALLFALSEAHYLEVGNPLCFQTYLSILSEKVEFVTSCLCQYGNYNFVLKKTLYIMYA